MATDPRAALERLVAALEAHLAAVERRRGGDDPAVEGAYGALADAFEVYDEALFTAYDEVTPLDLYEADDDALDDDDEGDDEDDDEDDDERDLDVVDDGTGGRPSDGQGGVSSR